MELYGDSIFPWLLIVVAIISLLHSFTPKILLFFSSSSLSLSCHGKITSARYFLKILKYCKLGNETYGVWRSGERTCR